jgi:hypothetical protein
MRRRVRRLLISRVVRGFAGRATNRSNSARHKTINRLRFFMQSFRLQMCSQLMTSALESFIPIRQLFFNAFPIRSLGQFNRMHRCVTPANHSRPVFIEDAAVDKQSLQQPGQIVIFGRHAMLLAIPVPHDMSEILTTRILEPAADLHTSLVVFTISGSRRSIARFSCPISSSVL